MKQIEQINLIDYIREINDKIIFPDSEEQDYVSEMKIHKILYIIYGNFYARFQKPLFKDAKFEAWQYGPVEIDFKNSDRSNDKFTIKLTSKQKDYVFKMIEKFLCFSPYTLVWHTTDTDPWIAAHFNKIHSIPNKEIQKWYRCNPLSPY